MLGEREQAGLRRFYELAATARGRGRGTGAAVPPDSVAWLRTEMPPEVGCYGALQRASRSVRLAENIDGDRDRTQILDGGRVDRARRSSCTGTRRTPLLGELADELRARKHPDASSPTSSTATSTTRTSASRGATSARSTGRSDRPKATCSGSRRSSARSTRRSRSAAGSCCCRAATIPDLPLEWYEDLFRAVKQQVSRRSSCTRCRRRRSFTCRASRGCRCRR